MKRGKKLEKYRLSVTPYAPAWWLVDNRYFYQWASDCMKKSRKKK